MVNKSTFDHSKKKEKIFKLNYLKVFKVCSHEDRHGLIIAIMQVLAFSPMKESLSTWVNLLALNGRWAPFLPRALMHSFNARRDLLISAPSILVCRLAELVSAPLSLPARSMRENLPCKGLLFMLILRTIWKTTWLLEEFALALVCPDVRRLLPLVINFRTSSTEVTSDSVRPTIWTCCFPSSKTRSFDFPDNKSKTFPL